MSHGNEHPRGSECVHNRTEDSMKMLLVVFALLLAALPPVAQPTKVDTDAKLKLSVGASTFRADDWSDWTPGTAAKGRRCPGDDDDDNDGIVAAWPWRADADRTQIGIGLAIPT